MSVGLCVSEDRLISSGLMEGLRKHIITAPLTTQPRCRAGPSTSLAIPDDADHRIMQQSMTRGERERSA